MRRSAAVCGFTIVLVSLLAAPSRAVTVDLTSGTTGTLSGVPQSFNETRGVDVTVLAGVNQNVQSMTLKGLYISTASGALGARIYNSGNASLIATANTTVFSGSNQTVTIPISATLASGASYRVSFFVSAGGFGGSGIMFDPNPPSLGGFPYTESTGTLTINQAYSTSSDAFPANANIFVPLISLAVQPCISTTADLTSGTTGNLTAVAQSFNETRGVDVTVSGGGDEGVQSMTLKGLYISTASALVGARIYNSGTSSLVASADTAVTTGSNLTVTVPLSATLTAGASYRLSFFVSAGGFGGSGIMFDPNPPSLGGFPYTESTGTLTINQAYSTSSDAFPANANIFVPQITLNRFSAEINDGLDNQCAGQPGYGLVDEISGVAGFFDPANSDVFSWPPQSGALTYQIGRALAPNFTAGCAVFSQPSNSFVDANVPSAQQVYYYLVRPLTPFPGSWGTASNGIERIVPCVP